MCVLLITYKHLAVFLPIRHSELLLINISIERNFVSGVVVAFVFRWSLLFLFDASMSYQTCARLINDGICVYHYLNFFDSLLSGQNNAFIKRWV